MGLHRRAPLTSCRGGAVRPLTAKTRYTVLDPRCWHLGEIDIREDHYGQSKESARAPVQRRPGLPTTHMARTVEHYRRLGFTFKEDGAPLTGEAAAGAGFAIAERDGVEFHFAVKPDHDPARTVMWVYVKVEDADELSAEFDAAGAGQGRVPRDTDYGMRELAHIDPDGNLLLFGSSLRGPLPTDEK
jgi:Glyoxalase/Bleomycin resistance protein/Dioxygenase superfamily